MSNTVKKAAIIGQPVAHSLSPVLHGYWLGQYDIKGTYEACALAPDQLEAFMGSLRKGAYAGVNVTTPYKEKVIPYLDVCDDIAKAVGAVNAITVRDGKLHGTNTDVYGFLENLRWSVATYKKQNAVVLGAGGAARAVCKALEMDGFSYITLCARNEEKAKAIAAHFSGNVSTAVWEKRDNSLVSCDLLVNTTPLGMKGKDTLDIALEQLPADASVYDIVYNPLMTQLLRHAKERGNPIVDGLGMLLYQAVPCFEAWFGVTPKVTMELRQYLQGKLA